MVTTRLVADLLVFITSAKLRGKFLGRPIYLARHFLLLPLTSTLSHPVESRLISLVYNHLQEGKFWFSYEWDLTRNLQTQTREGQNGLMWEMADDRFFWNKSMQAPLVHLSRVSDPGFSRYILPVLYGSFDLRDTVVQSRPVQLVLISRRSRLRAGTRYNTRGVDQQGNPGNAVETEQILIVPPGSLSNGATDTRVSLDSDERPRVVSFVQTRGSAPFYWAEIVNLVRVPDLVVMDKGEESTRVFRAHIDSQTAKYGNLLILNLVKGRGREKRIKDAYEKLVFDNQEKGQLDGVDYVHFDLHTETSGNRWHRVDEMTATLDDKLVANSYFQAGSELFSTPAKTQSGVVRTNCIDCLDRTNIMQTSIAKRVLDHQLHHLGILTDEQSVEAEETLLVTFRNVWSDHANFVAKAYTGTGALRTDFTRTGVRTRKGIIGDKLTSLWRYIMNNQVDGYKQDGFDLVTGAWQTTQSPAYAMMLLTDRRHWAIKLKPSFYQVPYILSFSILMVWASLLLPRWSTYPRLYPLLLWSSISTISAAYIVKNPNYYIAWPRLNFQPTLDAISYHRSTRKGASVVVEKGEKTILADAIKTQ
ncbi:hypothetical protein FRB99_004384 [Tulasnella sp. 403]|nr:hypothetical protein FRB99_004384 [Tulasnella sp. 403]